jgi:hypothetical protein
LVLFVLLRRRSWLEAQARQAPSAFGTSVARAALGSLGPAQRTPAPGQYRDKSDFDYTVARR